MGFGGKDVPLHDLRHTFASRLAMSGVDILSIEELLEPQDPSHGVSI
jgi:site-specific recombinase XerD